MSPLSSTEVDVEWIAASIPDNVMLLDLEGRIQYINFTVPDLTREQVLGRHSWEFLPPAEAARIRDRLQRIRETGQPDRYEMQYVSATGEVSEWESRTAPAWRDGVMVGFVAISSNITERRREAAMRRRLHDLSPDLLCVVSFDGRFTSVSPRVADLLGFTESEVTSRAVLDFVHPEDRARTAECMQGLRGGKPVTDFENRYRTKDGGYRTLSWRAIPEPGLGMIFAVGRDVTDRARLEAELQQAQKLDAVGRLAAGVAHDFNNLLLAIQANAELLRRRATDERARDYADQIVLAVKSGAALTRQLLGYGRGDPPVRARVCLAEAAETTLAMVRRLLPETIATELVCAGDLPAVWADRNQIDQVLLNLCINARDAMPSGGSLTVTIERGEQPDTVAMVVADTGVGIAPELLDRVFEPFFSTKGRDAGIGLGLSTAHGIVRAHGGTLTVTSEPGRGARFCVVLPAAREPAEPRPAAAAAPPVRADGRRETILVAEDSEPVRRAVVDLLEGAGYEVLTACDGEEALRMVADHGDRISAAVFDVLMPRMTGPAAARLLAASHPRLKVLFTSGYSEISVLATAGATPAEILAKPFTDQDLLDRLRALLEGVPTGASQPGAHRSD